MKIGEVIISVFGKRELSTSAMKLMNKMKFIYRWIGFQSEIDQSKQYVIYSKNHIMLPRFNIAVSLGHIR